MNILPLYIIKKINRHVNESRYDDCIDEFLRIFNNDSKHYNVKLCNIYQELLSELYLLPNLKYIKEIKIHLLEHDIPVRRMASIKYYIMNYPKYDCKKNYKEIYSKIKQDINKYNNNNLIAFPMMFFILNNNISSGVCVKYYGYFENLHYYKSNNENLNKIFDDYYIPKEYFDFDIDLSENVKFKFIIYSYMVEDYSETTYEYDIKFDKIPTLSDILKYNELIMLCTIQHLILSFRNYIEKHTDSIYNSETECPGDNVSYKVMNFAINLYKENYENLINDKIIREQVYPQFIKQLKNKEDNWFHVHGFRILNYHDIFTNYNMTIMQPQKIINGEILNIWIFNSYLY